MGHKLEVDGVKLAYHNRVILSDIYLKVVTGEVVGILGRNGCGKSSLLKIIFGLISAENKSVRLNGQYNPKLYQEKDAIKYLPQHSLFPPNLLVKDAVKLFIRGDENKREVLSIPQVKDCLSSRMINLSGGSRRLIETVVLLFSSAKFVILDEPFSHVSPLEIETIIELIQKQKKTKGIIVTDHVYQYVMDISDSKYFLSDGRLRKFDDMEDLVELNYINS